MFCKKHIGILGVAVLLAVWAYFTYDVNHRFPNPKNISIESGESTNYKGIKITPGEIEIYDYDGLIKQYSQLEMLYYIMDYEQESAKDSYFFLVPITMENPTTEPWSIGKESIVMWVLETGTTHNGVDYSSFSELNPDYDGNLEPGESQEITLAFSIHKEYMTRQEAMKWDKKIIYSYYPTKNFLYYPGEK